MIDRNFKKRQLQEMREVSPASIAKLGRNENVTTEVLLRICEALDCKIEDIMERVPIVRNEDNERLSPDFGTPKNIELTSTKKLFI